MYRIATIKKTGQLGKSTGSLIVRNYSTSDSTNNGNNNNNNNNGEVKKSNKRGKERFSEFVDDDEVVIDYRKVVEKKQVINEQAQDFDKMLANLSMKELKLMRFRDNPETFDLFKRQHFNINDAFNLPVTTKSLIEKQNQKLNQEFKDSQFKTQKITFNKLSQVKSDHIANELNKFKDQFEKPLLEVYNEVTNQSNLLYRTKRAEERLIKKKFDKKNKQYQLNSLERHYRDIVQVRNALDFRGKTILSTNDEEDAWQRILERTEISDPHNLSRLHMMDEYNDLGYQTELSEDYINQLSVVPFDFANPASYASLVNLLEQINTVDAYRHPKELAQLLLNKKLLQLNEIAPNSQDFKQLEKEICNDIEADNYIESLVETGKVPTVPEFSEEDFARLSKDELNELRIIKLAANRLQEYQDAKDNVYFYENPRDQNLIDNVEFLATMNKPSVANSKSTAQLLHVGDISLKAGSRPLTEEEIVDLLPYDEEVVEDPEDPIEVSLEDDIKNQYSEEDIQVKTAINREFFDEKGNFIFDQEQVQVVATPTPVEGGEQVNASATTTTTIKSATTEPETLFNEISYQEIDQVIADQHREDQKEIKYAREQAELNLEDRDNDPNDILNKRAVPSKLPDFDALSARIRKREEESLNAIAERFVDQEVNEKTAHDVLDQIYESYKSNNLFSPDVIEHDKNTIREANGDVAIPDSMYFEYDTTFGDLVDRDVLFKMPLKDTDLVRVLTHQLTESGLLKQEKVLKYTPDDMPVSKELVESLPEAFPNFVSEIIDSPSQSTDLNVNRLYLEEVDENEEQEEDSVVPQQQGEESIKSDATEFDEQSKQLTEELDSEEGEEGEKVVYDEDEEEIVIKRNEGGHEEIYDERRVYINLKPVVKDEGVITIPTIFKKKTNPQPLDEVESNDGWLMGKPFDMLDYRLAGQPNKLPIDEEQQENEDEVDMEEPSPIIEELVEEEDEDFKDLTPGIDQEPDLFEETDLYHYLQEGGSQEWFRPEKINDNDIALLQRRQTWYPNPRQHISTYPFEFVSTHNTTDQTKHDSWVNRKAVLKVNVSAFNLPETVESRLAELTASRYDARKRVLTLVADNHKTLPENKYEVKRLFNELLHEANLADPNFVSARTDNYKPTPPPSFSPSSTAKSQEKFTIYRLQGFPILNTQQKQHLELYSYIKSQLE